MNADRRDGERNFLFMDLKTISFIVANLIMLSNTCKLIIDHFTIEKNKFTLIDLDFPGNITFPFEFTTPLLGAVISVISFTVVLFLCLYMDYRRPTIELTFYYFIISLLAIYCIMWEFVFFVNQTVTLYRVLVVGVIAVLLYVIRCFWMKLNSYNRGLGEHA